MLIVIRTAVMQNKYLANEKSIHAKIMLRTYPLARDWIERHADLTCVSRNQVPRFRFRASLPPTFV